MDVDLDFSAAQFNLAPIAGQDRLDQCFQLVNAARQIGDGGKQSGALCHKQAALVSAQSYRSANEIQGRIFGISFARDDTGRVTNKSYSIIRKLLPLSPLVQHI